MPKIIQYKTVEGHKGHSQLTIDEIVNDLLLNGWQPYGNPYSFHAGSNGIIVRQVMVKYETQVSDNPPPTYKELHP